MKIFKKVDLTEGKTWKVILLFAIPIVLASVLGSAFSIINSLVLKTTVGGDSVTAISSTSSISVILFQFAYGCSGGFATLTSANYGKKDEKSVRKSFYNGLYLSIFIGLFITVLGLLVYKELLLFLEVDTVYLAKAEHYYFIILVSFVLMLLSNYLGNTLRAFGDSTAPLIISVISTLVNVLFAFVLTGLIKWDTRGVAVATAMANLLSVVISSIYLLKKYNFLSIDKSIEKMEFKMCSKLLKLGIPLGLQYSILFFGTFFQSKTVNSFGPQATKAAGCFSTIENYLVIPTGAIAASFLTFVAQNYGKNNFERIKKGFKQAILIDLVLCAVIFIAGLLFTDYVPYIFLPKSEVDDPVNGPLIKYYCSTYISCVFPLIILHGILTVSRSMLQGIQKTFAPFLSGVGELVARLSVCFFLPKLIDPANHVSKQAYIGVCFSSPAAWLISTIIMGGFAMYFIFYKPIRTTI